MYFDDTKGFKFFHIPQMSFCFFTIVMHNSFNGNGLMVNN